MKKIILSLIVGSMLFAENSGNTLDKVMLDLSNKNFDSAITQLKSMKETPKIDFLIGKAYFDKHLTYTDYKLAYNYLKKSNTPQALYYIAKMYEKGLFVKQDMKEAIRYFKNSNTKEAKYRLAMIYLKGEYVLKDPKEGLKLLQASAKAGYNLAKFELGKLYLSDNEIVDKDLEQAAKWIFLAQDDDNLRPAAQKIWNKYKLYLYQNK